MRPAAARARTVPPVAAASPPRAIPSEWLNYHHLFYFWCIAQDGVLARAADRLRLSHSTLSSQLKALEEFLGAELFERRGRRLVLTPFGAEVASYATDIFRTGSELIEVARGRSVGRQPVLEVGVVGSLPKSITHQLIEPGLQGEPRHRVRVHQFTPEILMEELVAGRLHLALCDAPPGDAPASVHLHRLGESAIYFHGTVALAERHGSTFPASLDGAPVVLPSSGGLRRALDRWFVDRGLRVDVQAECDDAGLLRVLGGAGIGLFPVRAALRTEVEEAHGAVCVGLVDGVREEYFALTMERRIRHRAVARIVERARARLGKA